jgi:hypothetical protein
VGNTNIEDILNYNLKNDGFFSEDFYINKIKPHLVAPVKRKFINPISGEMEEHWVVFDENKESEETGYLIFYSEIDNEFGLGTKTNLKKLPGSGTFIGIYGSFSDAFNSM